MLPLFRIAQFFLGIFTSLTTFFKAYIAGRFVVAAAFSTVLIGMTAALFVAIKGLLLGVALTVSNPYMLLGMKAVMPANLPLVISVYFAARITIWAYLFNRKLINNLFGAGLGPY